MKRIAIFCDGTWNTMSARFPTNVLMAARAVNSVGDDGVLQIKFYDEGVGTSHTINRWLETRLAGAFGWGLIGKIETAYRFLIFNYEPGDEIFIFGFSRGAFTARSLAGLIRKCGIVGPHESHKIREIFDFYKDVTTHPNSDEAQRFRMEHSPHIVVQEEDRRWLIAHGRPPDEVAKLPRLVIRYIGAWDTVGALGIPRHSLLSWILQPERKYGFHDTDLSSSVVAARHAVAVDERRKSFAPSAWRNLDRLNADKPEPKYRQLWFPGDHGSVGGGGDIVGLSHNAFDWVMAGAADEGLGIDQTYLASVRSEIDHFAPLSNQSNAPGLMSWFYRRGDRDGPTERAMLAESTITRLDYEAKGREYPLYRPKALKHLWPQGRHAAP